MSETVRTLVESLLMIGGITGGLVWYAIAAGRHEVAESSRSSVRPTVIRTFRGLDPDSHLGHRGAD